jgi:hypothetical protein
MGAAGDHHAGAEVDVSAQYLNVLKQGGLKFATLPQQEGLQKEC